MRREAGQETVWRRRRARAGRTGWTSGAATAWEQCSPQWRGCARRAAGLFSEADGQLGFMGQRDHHSEFSFLLATDVSGSTGHGSSLGRNVLNCCGVDTLIS